MVMVTPTLSSSSIADINTLARFLAFPQVSSLNDHTGVDVLVLCVSAILPIADQVFSALQLKPDLAKTLVLCGGIGHSTPFLYQAIRESKYSAVADQVDGLPEARVLEVVIKEYYPDLQRLVDLGTIELVVEDRSTNCGANASETRRLLEEKSLMPQSFIIVQDPTMSRRTVASFEKVYANVAPQPMFLACPTFVPKMGHVSSDEQSRAVYDVAGIHEPDLWDVRRFLDLLLGEIPRLRDDENGYGPKGKGFITHVNVPDDVETAWGRLRELVDSTR
jgi:hypothetical protein